MFDERVREGARRMLAEALQADVDAYCARYTDERNENGRRPVVRNGCHEPREVTTAAGAVALHAPRVNDKRIDPETGERQRFSSAILPRWARKTPQIEAVLPLLYLHGLSSGDFVPALVKKFEAAYGAKYPKAVAKITDEAQQLLAFYDLPAEHWVQCTCALRIQSDPLSRWCATGARSLRAPARGPPVSSWPTS